MAERRMFAKTIIESDAFLDMPLSAQALYFHLSMRADDDGFINNPKKIQRMICAPNDDLKLLAAKGFIIPFKSGIVVIKLWRIHNYIQKDRYKETNYSEEKQQLILKKNGAYSKPDTACIQNVSSSETQVRLGKDSKGKDSTGYISNTNVLDCPAETGRFTEIVESWNSLSVYGIAQVKRIVDGSVRAKQLKARISQYGEDAIIEAIDRIRRSKFLQGDNNRGWIITFDWFIKPSNFAKVYEGNYDNGNHKQADNKFTQKLVDIGEWGKQFEQQD